MASFLGRAFEKRTLYVHYFDVYVVCKGIASSRIPVATQTYYAGVDLEGRLAWRVCITKFNCLTNVNR